MTLLRSTLIALSVSILCGALPREAAGYTMSFSVYNDVTSNSNTTSLVAYSNVSDNSSCYSHSNYMTTVAVRSPSGRNASKQSSGLSSTTSLGYGGEKGYFNVSTSGTYTCGCTGLNLGFGFSVRVKIGYWAQTFDRTSQGCSGMTRYNRSPTCNIECNIDYTCWLDRGKYLVLTGVIINSTCYPKTAIRVGYDQPPGPGSCFYSNPPD